MLPFQAQTIVQLSARYSAALKPLYDYRVALPIPLPSDVPAQVFDCESGIRLIISRDQETDAEIYLHVSASLQVGCELYRKVLAGQIDQKEFMRLVAVEWFCITGNSMTLELGVPEIWSERGIPHWRRKL